MLHNRLFVEGGVGGIADRSGAAAKRLARRVGQGVNRTKIGRAIAPDANLLDRKILDAATGSIDFCRD